ncbi:MAG: hypothetical protein AAF399_11750 [Bacteroidota bacterium]
MRHLATHPRPHPIPSWPSQGYHWLGWIGLFWLLMSSSVGVGQTIPITYSDQEGNVQKGQFQVTYVQLFEGVETVVKGQILSLNFTDSKKAFLEVRISDLEWENADFFGKLSVLNGDINPGENSPIEPTRSKKDLTPGDKGPKSIRYRVHDEGTYRINFNYRISEKGKTNDILGNIQKNVVIRIGASAAVSTPPSTEPAPSGSAQSEPETLTSGSDDDPEEANPEEEDWEAIVELVLAEDDPKEQKKIYQRFLEQYPSGPNAELARNELKQIEKEIASNQSVDDSPPPPSSRPTPKQSTSAPEAQLFATIQRSKRVKDCEQYFRTYGPTGKYAEEVQDILNDVSPIKLISQGYSPGSQEECYIKLAYAKEPITHRISGGKGPGSYWDDVWHPEDSSLTISVGKGEQIKVRFEDDRGKRITVEVDSRFPPLNVQEFAIQASESNSNATTSFSFQIAGGDPPYYAQFIRFGGTDPTLEIPLPSSTGERTISIQDVQAMQGDSVILNGPYSIRFVDQRHSESVFFKQPKDLVRIFPPESTSPWITIGLIALGILALIFILRRINRKKVAARKEKVEQKIKEKQRQTTSLPMVETTTQPTIKAAPHGPQTTSPPPVADPSPPKTRATVRITRKEAAETGNVPMRAFSASPESADYHRLQLTEIWPEPAVSDVYLNQEVIQQLDTFIHEENVDSFREEQNDLIPEIGGFLMGTYQQVAGIYQVAIEKFQPITAEAQDLYKVEFGVTAWSELANVQDMYPDLRTIGWFHTHPGHGLFLSQPDLRIQEGFFKEKFQLAMEIDTKSSGLDTTFFARNTDGVIYNSRDRIRDDWYQWVSIRETGASDPTS